MDKSEIRYVLQSSMSFMFRETGSNDVVECRMLAILSSAGTQNVTTFKLDKPRRINHTPLYSEIYDNREYLVVQTKGMHRCVT